jgi:hypothetical protein
MPLERSSFALLFLGLGACLVAYWATAFGRHELIDLTNMTVPLVMGGILLYAAYRNIAYNHLLVWSPLPYFLVSCTLYFSIGPALYYFGSESLIWEVNQIYGTTPEELLRTNLLNAIGISIVLGTLYISLSLLSSVRKIIPNQQADYSTEMIQLKVGATILLGIGLPTKYLLTLPYELNMLDYIVPGVVYRLQSTIPIAIVMLCVLAHRSGGIWRVLFYGVTVAELFTATMTFSKLDVLITLMMLTLGYFVVYPRPRTLAVGFCAILLVYVLLVPLVLYGRAETSQFAEGAGLGDRFEIVQKYLADGTPDDAGESEQGWWGRLGYAPYQAFVMAEYDAGRPGETVELALYIPIPRSLWPEKPTIAVGRDLYYLMTGHTTTQVAAGIFAEAYWNGGWLLVIIVCVYVGILFASFTIYSLRRMALQQFFFLPVVFFGINVGFRADGLFASTYVGDVLNAIVMHWVLVAILAVIPMRRLFRPRPA